VWVGGGDTRDEVVEVAFVVVDVHHCFGALSYQI
jgi:hypothetical protein